MRRMILIAATLLIATVFFAACGEQSDSQKQRNNSVKARTDTFARAEAKHPIPRTENFPLRKTLVEMTKREDLLNHPWYVYVMADTGNVIGYYVAKSAPINACNFLSSTEELADGTLPGGDVDYEANFVMKAPSLDGVFYGDAVCNVFVFEDYTTNAIIKLGDIKFFVADKPLNLDAEAIKVSGKG